MIFFTLFVFVEGGVLEAKSEPSMQWSTFVVVIIIVVVLERVVRT